MNMQNRLLPFGTLMVTALNTGLTCAHLLEMPAKRRLDAQSYLKTQQIYRTFGPVGGLLEPASVLAAALLTYAGRRRSPAFQMALTGTGLLVTALAAWLALVAPMNAKMDQWAPDALPRDWQSTRDQWEYAHAGRAVLQALGLGALVYSVLVQTGRPGVLHRLRDAVS
jgi:hypothetical protein